MVVEASGMEFCPKCGSMMKPKREENKIILYCSSCGFSKPLGGEASSYKFVSEIKHAPDKTMVVIDESKLPKVLPTIRIECPKCGNMEAYWWMVQTRRADESPTRFFRCTKCGYTWREYD